MNINSIRTAVLILGLLGAAASGVLAERWLREYTQQRIQLEPLRPLLEIEESLHGHLAELDDRIRAGRALMGSSLLAVLGCVLVLVRHPRWAAIPMLIAGFVPAFFDPYALVFSGLIGLAGFLAPAIKTASPSLPRTEPIGPHA